MIKLLVLPLLWTAFYGISILCRNLSADLTRYIVAGASMLLLFLSTSFITGIFYSSVCLSYFGVAWYLGKAENEKKRKIVFQLTIISSICLIIGYLVTRNNLGKYFVFLPSLSYLGFRAISMVVTAYQDRGFSKSAGLVSLFFFPILFLGPIARLDSFEVKSTNLNTIVQRIAAGFTMLVCAHIFGLMIPDLQNALVELRIFYWLGAFAISMEFYLTFAGYSHLIIALGAIFGFTIPENFNNPYFSKSVGEFWRRWHMSLSFWIRDYLYIPLGGNRRGLATKCALLIFCMTIVGLWHGLTLNYFVWGLLHGFALALESVVTQKFLHSGKSVEFSKFNSTLVNSLRRLATFCFVTFTWIIFRYDLNDAYLYFSRMVFVQ